MTEVVTTHDLELLHQKIDYLTEQLDEQRMRQREFDELKQDMIPIANHMMKLTIDELADIGSDFQAEDFIFLMKRLLRNTHSFIRLMDYLEAGIGLSEEVSQLGTQMFNNLVETLDRLEHEGYFGFLNEGWNIVERIVTEFSEEDVKALGDNIVTILGTVRTMTQPEILNLANNAIGAIEATPVEDEDISTLALLRELSDPQVRRGMARMLNIVKALADEPGANNGKERDH
ncbi:MAG: DUF1641 domain-containing protein [Anaerolineales bacterium]